MTTADRAGRVLGHYRLVARLGAGGMGEDGSAHVRAMGGRDPDALHWLEPSFEPREGDRLFMKVDPGLDRLHSHPRFMALLGRIGLER